MTKPTYGKLFTTYVGLWQTRHMEILCGGCEGRDIWRVVYNTRGLPELRHIIVYNLWGIAATPTYAT